MASKQADSKQIIKQTASRIIKQTSERAGRQAGSKQIIKHSSAAPHHAGPVLVPGAVTLLIGQKTAMLLLVLKFS